MEDISSMSLSEKKQWCQKELFEARFLEKTLKMQNNTEELVKVREYIEKLRTMMKKIQIEIIKEEKEGTKNVRH